MTADENRAELRRSACEDRDPLDGAGLSRFTFHDTRHTAATWIGRSGKLQLLELCKMFGWSDPKMAMIYFNPSADDLANKL